MLRPGDHVGQWIVDDPLGEGGMATVYRVHSAMSRLVPAALKLLKEDADPEARRGFVREAEALASVRHPAIVRVLGINEDPARGVLALVMELASGETLRDRIQRGPVPVAEALWIFAPLADGLAHAHAEGVAHRDVKPANVVLCADGPRLVDFGIATRVDIDVLARTRVGTLAYLPPEVFREEEVLPSAADVYAFGLVMHEALTGIRAFPSHGPDAQAVLLAAHKRRQAAFDPGPRFASALRALVRAATDPDPGARPTMAALRDDLDRLVERRSDLLDVGRTRRLPETPSQDSGDHDGRTTFVPDPAAPPGRLWRPGALVAGSIALLAALWLARSC